MFEISQKTVSSGRYRRILFIRMMVVIGIAIFAATAFGQSPTPKPADEEDMIVGGYKVTTTTEFGYRFRELYGNENKYNSDLNYKKGFRLFDSNILFEADSGKGKYFDSLLISNTGWGADPTGFSRVNVEKTGIYKFNSTVRRVKYFNNLSNFALQQHTSNTRHSLGDFDLTLLPQNEKLRFNFGASFSNLSGPGVSNARAYRDDFPVIADYENRSNDFRAGVEGRLFGFNLGLTQGFRSFKDRSQYFLTAPNVGNNPADTTVYNTFSRTFPTDGNAYFTHFNAHRTFAKKLDFTGQLIYTSTDSKMGMLELISGRDNSNKFIDRDRFDIYADAKRVQARGDLGLTYMVTNNFRISNSFSFDRFAVNGGEKLEEWVDRRNAAGNPLASTFTRSAAYRVNDYRRYVNTIEGDYQFNNRVSVHVGYRYTNRMVDVMGYDITLTSAPSSTNPRNILEDEKNSTHTLIAGMKIKPVKNWVIFWDVEKGSADNVFSRLENYKFTNFRVRSKVTLNKFSFNFSAVAKDNNNPSQTPTALNFGTDIKNYFYSGSVEWAPMDKVQVSSGYTYHHLTADTPIIVSVDGVSRLGFSQFFMRDHYGYLDISAKPIKRLSLYGSLRINRDKGQENRFSTLPEIIYGGYPMNMLTPEFRAAIRLTRNVDWNIGYQYYNYQDSQTPSQNYRAHLPYTSLKIYFGGGAADR